MTECSKVDLSLRVNGNKTNYLTYNIDDHPPLVRHSPLTMYNDTVLEEKDDLKFLGSGSRVDESQKDISVRKGLAWKAHYINGMYRIWKSNGNQSF